MFKLGVITDEVSQDFEAALQFAAKHELDCVELRSAWEKDPFEYTEEDIAEIKRLSDKYEMPVLAISSPLFKCSYFDAETRQKHMEGLKRVVKYANILGAKMIRSFDFFREEGVTLEQIAEAYKEPIALCAEHGITLLLESEPTANSYDCKSIAATVEFINSPYVRSLYEPGNDIYSPTEEIPFPEGFEHVKATFAHVHVKDAVKENGTAKGVAIGNGVVDYEGIVKALLDMNYTGAVMLETHYKPNIVMDEELLKNPKGSQISYMGDVASEECMIALKGIINEVQKK